ncbi:MAG TPA: sigma-70 family RNA polymerase sigma factor [Candidatus Lumbricidophila sp.]|nr:sigma-70 family RNA polymerase sigma factor [Candidatus Lumbricidophila sp.]
MSQEVTPLESSSVSRFTPSDLELVDATRAGDADAYGLLWKRHYTAAKREARKVTGSFDPEDLAQEAFASVYLAITEGGGPRTAFRAYLLMAVRNIAIQWSRKQKEEASDELEFLADPRSSERELDRQSELTFTSAAFRALPERWQQVLVYTEVYEMKPQQVAERMGIKPHAVAQLALRAREGLREEWVQAHLRSMDESSICAWFVKRLGCYTRGSASPRDRKKIAVHLESCTACSRVAEEARTASSRLAVVLPLVLAGGAAGALALSGTSGSASSVVAMSAASGVGSSAASTGTTAAVIGSVSTTVAGTTSAVGAGMTAAVSAASSAVATWSLTAAVSAVLVIGGGAVIGTAVAADQPTKSSTYASSKDGVHESEQHMSLSRVLTSAPPTVVVPAVPATQAAQPGSEDPQPTRAPSSSNTVSASPTPNMKPSQRPEVLPTATAQPTTEMETPPARTQNPTPMPETTPPPTDQAVAAPATMAPTPAAAPTPGPSPTPELPGAPVLPQTQIAVNAAAVWTESDQRYAIDVTINGTAYQQVMLTISATATSAPSTIIRAELDASGSATLRLNPTDDEFGANSLVTVTYQQPEPGSSFEFQKSIYELVGW